MQINFNQLIKMSVKFKGSQTEKNLLIAFAGESQARNRYTFFASQAKKEGLIQISDILRIIFFYLLVNNLCVYF